MEGWPLNAGIGSRPETPLEWIGWLEAKLSTQRSQVRKYSTYYDSENKVSNYAQAKFSEIFGDMFVGWRDNFCPLIVDSISERLRIQGFRMGPDEPADAEATEIWQYNSLDAESNAAHIDALMGGAAFVTVWGDEDDQPLMVPEPAEDVVVQYEPGSRRKRAASLKQYVDDWGVEHATLWTPDRVFTTDRKHTGSEGERKWAEPVEQPNPLKVVPVIPLFNRTRLKLTPFSELAAIIPVQDAINKVAADALVASEFAAFPQRILAGWLGAFAVRWACQPTNWALQPARNASLSLTVTSAKSPFQSCLGAYSRASAHVLKAAPLVGLRIRSA